MTSDPAKPSAARFPIGLTLATAMVVAICSALGVWQLQRAQWKNDQLARLAAMRTAPAVPLAPVLARAARGENVDLVRVVADCRGRRRCRCPSG